MNGTGGEGVRIDRAGGGREMTMATDARKGVSEWPTTSKRRCREGARTGRGPNSSSNCACLLAQGITESELSLVR